MSILNNKLIELEKQQNNQQKDIGYIQKQIPFWQEWLIKTNGMEDSQTRNIELIKKDIEDIKKIQQQPITLLSPKIEGMSVILDHLKQDFQNMQNQQQSLFQSLYSLPNNSSNNLQSEITSIKSSITNLQTSMQAVGVLNSIEKYGPFVANSWQQIYNMQGYNIAYFQTSELCLITVKGKAVVTLIVTGDGINTSGWAQMIFLKDRVNHLQHSNPIEYLDGAGYLNDHWLPINLTQEFFVEKGTYEFQLAFRLANGGSSTVTIHSLSFYAKVMYYT